MGRYEQKGVHILLYQISECDWSGDGNYSRELSWGINRHCFLTNLLLDFRGGTNTCIIACSNMQDETDTQKEAGRNNTELIEIDSPIL